MQYYNLKNLKPTLYVLLFHAKFTLSIFRRSKSRLSSSSHEYWLRAISGSSLPFRFICPTRFVLPPVPPLTSTCCSYVFHHNFINIDHHALKVLKACPYSTQLPKVTVVSRKCARGNDSGCAECSTHSSF